MIIAWFVTKLALFLIGRGIGGAFAKILAPIIIYGGFGLAVWFGGPWLWNHFIAEPYREEGRVEVQTKWNAAVEAEKDRVAKAMAEAQAEAQKTIDELEKREEELNAELEKARAEADNDPAGDDCGISADGVRRLQRIR